MSNRFSGMTVNERLYVSGLIKEFDDAVIAKDIDRIRLILKMVEILDENQVDSILKSVGVK